MFGSKVEVTLPNEQTEKPVAELFESNQKKVLSAGVQPGCSTVFHGGIIGRGLKPVPRPSPFSQVNLKFYESVHVWYLWIWDYPREILDILWMGPPPFLNIICIKIANVFCIKREMCFKCEVLPVNMCSKTSGKLDTHLFLKIYFLNEGPVLLHNIYIIPIIYSGGAGV